jgi:hypothetical protein
MKFKSCWLSPLSDLGCSVENAHALDADLVVAPFDQEEALHSPVGVPRVGGQPELRAGPVRARLGAPAQQPNGMASLVAGAGSLESQSFSISSTIWNCGQFSTHDYMPSSKYEGKY